MNSAVIGSGRHMMMNYSPSQDEFSMPKYCRHQTGRRTTEKRRNLTRDVSWIISEVVRIYLQIIVFIDKANMYSWFKRFKQQQN